MTRFEEFKQEVAKCNSSVELAALLVATTASICPINHQEGRCDMRVCHQHSQDCCLKGMEEYFDSNFPFESVVDNIFDGKTHSSQIDKD